MAASLGRPGVSPDTLNDVAPGWPSPRLARPRSTGVRTGGCRPGCMLKSPRYAPTTGVETFPFPAGLNPADTAHQRTEPADHAGSERA